MLALIGFLLISAAAIPTAEAATLGLRTVLESPSDLVRVVARTDGYAVLDQERIRLLDRGGAVLGIESSGPGQTIHLGDSGGWMGLARHRPGAADFSPVESFELRDDQGNTAWRLGPTEDVTFVISSEGRLAGLSLNINVPERNTVHFYSSGGALAGQATVPYLTEARFDRAGAVFFALSIRDGLRAFSPEGAELWQAAAGTRLFAAAPGGRFVATVDETALTFLDAGRAGASVPLEGLLARRVAISPDGRRMAVAGKKEIRVFETSPARLLWKESVEDTDLAWTSIDLAAGDGWLVAGAARELGPDVPIEQRHPDGEVRAYDALGRLRHQARLTFPIWNIWTPTVLLDRDGRNATVTTRRAIYRTELP